ncbi:hypothetical protein ACET3Z_024206 [Daucus carota]
MAPGGAVNMIERAHQMYREGKYEEALVFYTDALGLAKTKPQKIALHSNRAACFLKLHRFNKAADECTSVLELDYNHTGALMLRAQTLVTLKEYHAALFDVNRLIDLNPESDVYQNLQARLKTQMSLAPIPEAETEFEEDEDSEEEQDQEDEIEVEEGLDQQEENDKKDEHVGGELEANAVVERNISTENGSTVTGKNALQSSDHCQKVEKDTDQSQRRKESSEQNSAGWQTIPKPKGHSNLDYSRWDRVEDDSSDEDDDEDEEESQPQYRFRVRTVGVQQVK